MLGIGGATTLRSGRQLPAESDSADENPDRSGGLNDGSVRPRRREELVPRTGEEDLPAHVAEGGDASGQEKLDEEACFRDREASRRSPYSNLTRRYRDDGRDNREPENSLFERLTQIIREERRESSSNLSRPVPQAPLMMDRNVQVDGMGQRRAMNPMIHRMVRPTRMEYEPRESPPRRVERDIYAHQATGSPNRRARNVAVSHRTKAPLYDGTSSWTDYLVQFELVAELNGWDDGLMAMHLATSLRGVAQSVLGDLDEYGRRDYRSLVACLSQRFGPENQTEMFRALLRNRIRQPNETLPDLAHEIRRLVKLAYPTGQYGILEDLSKNHFIDAIPEADSRWHIQQSRPRSLDEAVRVAVELEAFQVAEKHRGTNKKTVRVVKESSHTEDDASQDQRLKRTEEALVQMQQTFQALELKLENVCDNIQQKENTVTRRESDRKRKDWKPIECYHCGEPGHKRPECPKYREELGRRRRGDRNSRNLGN